MPKTNKKIKPFKYIKRIEKFNTLENQADILDTFKEAITIHHNTYLAFYCACDLLRKSSSNPQYSRQHKNFIIFVANLRSSYLKKTNEYINKIQALIPRIEARKSRRKAKLSQDIQTVIKRLQGETISLLSHYQEKTNANRGIENAPYIINEDDNSKTTKIIQALSSFDITEDFNQSQFCQEDHDNDPTRPTIDWNQSYYFCVESGICLGLTSEFLRIRHSEKNRDDLPGLSTESIIKAHQKQSVAIQNMRWHTLVNRPHSLGKRIPTGPSYSSIRRQLNKAFNKIEKGGFFLAWYPAWFSAGHVVAVSKIDVSHYEFYDSNEGLWKFSSLDSLMQHLDNTYNHINGVTKDGLTHLPPACSFMLLRYYSEQTAKQSLKHFIQYKIANPWYYCNLIGWTLYFACLIFIPYAYIAIPIAITVLALSTSLRNNFLTSVAWLKHNIGLFCHRKWQELGFATTPKQNNIASKVFEKPKTKPPMPSETHSHQQQPYSPTQSALLPNDVNNEGRQP